jgi:hypothetical protein
MWFRRFIDPFAVAAPWIGGFAIAALPIIGARPVMMHIPALVIGLALAGISAAMVVARMIWEINKVTLTDGGPGLRDFSDLNRRPIQSKWLRMPGFDLYIAIPLYALVLLAIMFGASDWPTEAKNWSIFNALFLMGAGHYTRKANLFANQRHSDDLGER